MLPECNMDCEEKVRRRRLDRQGWGSFPREVLASRNLTFSPYKMPGRRNKREFYDAKTLKPAPAQQGAIHFGAVSLAAAAQD